MESVTFLADSTEIWVGAFRGCVSLKRVKLPAKLERIDDVVFCDCTSLESLDFLAGVTEIGDSAFAGCTGLTSVTIPAGVTTIGIGVFAECTGLTSVTIPAGVTTIGPAAFTKCTGLTSVTIPAGVTAIGDSAFAGCTDLTSVTIPAGVTEIGSYAFDGCSNLQTAHFKGDAPTTVGADIFANTHSSFYIQFDEGTTGWTTPTWHGYPTIRLEEVEGILIFDTPDSISVNPDSCTALVALYKQSGQLTAVHTPKYSDGRFSLVLEEADYQAADRIVLFLLLPDHTPAAPAIPYSKP